MLVRNPTFNDYFPYLTVHFEVLPDANHIGLIGHILQNLYFPDFVLFVCSVNFLKGLETFPGQQQVKEDAKQLLKWSFLNGMSYEKSEMEYEVVNKTVQILLKPAFYKF